MWSTGEREAHRQVTGGDLWVVPLGPAVVATAPAITSAATSATAACKIGQVFNKVLGDA